MVTKTQFPLKSHRDIALVPLNKRRRSDGGSGASPSSTSLASTAASSPPRGRVAASQTSIDTPPSATPLRLIFTRARIGPRWGGAQDNESYGGISIKTQKANMRKSEFLMLEALKSAPHLNDKANHVFGWFWPYSKPTFAFFYYHPLPFCQSPPTWCPSLCLWQGESNAATTMTKVQKLT